MTDDYTHYADHAEDSADGGSGSEASDVSGGHDSSDDSSSYDSASYDSSADDSSTHDSSSGDHTTSATSDDTSLGDTLFGAGHGPGAARTASTDEVDQPGLSADDDLSPAHASLGVVDHHGPVRASVDTTSDAAGASQDGVLTDRAELAGLAPASLPGLGESPFSTDPDLVGEDPSISYVDPQAPGTVGHPEIDQQYYQYQLGSDITPGANAFCGPYSATMALDALMGDGGPTADEVVQRAVSMNLIRQTPDAPDGWGGWSGMTPDDLKVLVDSYVDPDAPPGQGESTLVTGASVDTLSEALGSNQKVLVQADPSELEGRAVDEGPDGVREPGHMLEVTGINQRTGMVFLNDPLERRSTVLSLQQFEGAWNDSGNTMLAIPPTATTTAAASSPASTSPTSPTSTTSSTSSATTTSPDPATTVPDVDDCGPLIDLPTVTSDAVTSSDSWADSLSALTPPEGSGPAVPDVWAPQGCCLLTMTLHPVGCEPVATAGQPTPDDDMPYRIPEQEAPDGAASSIVPLMGAAARR